MLIKTAGFTLWKMKSITSGTQDEFYLHVRSQDSLCQYTAALHSLGREEEGCLCSNNSLNFGTHANRTTRQDHFEESPF